MAPGASNPQGVVRQLINTQFRVEHAFKNRINRELKFKGDKMKILDKVLHAKHIAAEMEESENDRPLSRSWSSPTLTQTGGRVGLGSPTAAAGGAAPGASWSSLSWSASSACMGPEPYTTARPQGTARTRLGSSMPLSWHPVSHPGATGVGGHASGSAAASPSQSRGSFARGCGSPRGQLLPSKSPREALARQELREVTHKLGTLSVGLGGGGALSADPPEPTEEYLITKMQANNIEQEIEALGLQKDTETTEMTERLGDLIGMLGPRYKTVNKSLIWERATKGDTSAFQRRLQKAKESGAVPADFVAMATRQDPAARMEAIGPDVDGVARREWLWARRRARMENVPVEVALEGLGGANAFIGQPLRPPPVSP
eukprot:TRINITY_DN45789_c0_g1_i1.p2 TRINITY_DN45789_c0_g1~~TRINITY_DN45789_c0_g1_i1.p2  ORF type:complete len:373 (-),score=72.27 TRINITY_DN45789_c0_g1_i1:148-1266(-)